MSFDPISAGIDLIKTIIDKSVPDKGQAANLKAQIDAQKENDDVRLLLGQMSINQEEAKSTNWFVAGWRPYVGWICGTGLGYQFLFMPLANGLCMAIWKIQPFMALDVATLVTCLGGLLGFGTMRAFEKANGVAR